MRCPLCGNLLLDEMVHVVESMNSLRAESGRLRALTELTQPTQSSIPNDQIRGMEAVVYWWQVHCWSYGVNSAGRDRGLRST